MPAIGTDTSVWVTAAQSTALVAGTVVATVAGGVLMARAAAQNLEKEAQLNRIGEQQTGRKRVKPLTAAPAQPTVAGKAEGPQPLQDEQ